jgi:glutaredoxin-related protein
MPRHILDDQHLHPDIRDKVATHHAEIVETVLQAIQKNDYVVVGMAQNPEVSKVRKALSEAGLVHAYLEFGSYFSQWRRRNALKMWTGWPTFPMVFHKGVLLGGHKDTKALLAQGALTPQVNTPD